MNLSENDAMDVTDNLPGNVDLAETYRRQSSIDLACKQIAYHEDSLTKDASPVSDMYKTVMSTLGINSSLDIVFLEYTKLKSAFSVVELMKETDGPIFMMPLLNPHPVCPAALFLEKTKTVDTNEEIYVVYVVQPSTSIGEKLLYPGTITEFHEFYAPYMKKHFGYSIEEIYNVFDKKRGEKYCITQGDRQKIGHEDDLLILSVSENFVTPLFFPPPRINSNDEYKVMCGWISAKIPCVVRNINEGGIYSLMPKKVEPDSVTDVNDS